MSYQAWSDTVHNTNTTATARILLELVRATEPPAAADTHRSSSRSTGAVKNT